MARRAEKWGEKTSTLKDAAVTIFNIGRDRARVFSASTPLSLQLMVTAHRKRTRGRRRRRRRQRQANTLGNILYPTVVYWKHLHSNNGCTFSSRDERQVVITKLPAGSRSQ